MDPSFLWTNRVASKNIRETFRRGNREAHWGDKPRRKALVETWDAVVWTGCETWCGTYSTELFSELGRYQLMVEWMGYMCKLIQMESFPRVTGRKQSNLMEKGWRSEEFSQRHCSSLKRWVDVRLKWINFAFRIPKRKRITGKRKVCNKSQIHGSTWEAPSSRLSRAPQSEGLAGRKYEGNREHEPTVKSNKKGFGSWRTSWRRGVGEWWIPLADFGDLGGIPSDSCPMIWCWGPLSHN